MYKKKILGIPYYAWSETILLLTLLLVMNQVLGDGKRWIDSQIQPFWVVVLLISAQYGTLAGLMSAAASTLFLYAGNLPDQKITETFFDYQFRLAFLPGLWIIVAFILGEIRMRLEDKNRHLENELTEMRKQADAVVSGYEKIKASKEYQELSIASQKHSAAALYQTFKYLGALNPAHILRDLDKIVVTALNPKKFSVYAWGANGFEAASSYGWTNNDHYLSRIPVGHPLYVEIADKRRLVCVVNQNDEKILDGQGLIAAPLIDTDSNEVFGFVKIEAVNYMEFNLPTLRIFKILCELIGSAYSHARKYKSLAQHAIYGRQAGIFSNAAYTLQRMLWQQLLEIQPLAISEITFAAAELPSEAKEMDRQETELARLLLAHVHSPAQVFEAGTARLCFRLLLPGLSIPQAEALALQLVNAIAASEPLRSFKCTQKIVLLSPTKDSERLTPESAQT